MNEKHPLLSPPISSVAQTDATATTARVGALKESDSNRFYVRHGFQLVESGEFDNYYLRPQRLPMC